MPSLWVYPNQQTGNETGPPSLDCGTGVLKLTITGSWLSLIGKGRACVSEEMGGGEPKIVRTGGEEETTRNEKEKGNPSLEKQDDLNLAR